MKRRLGITRTQRNIADMLRAAGRKVTVIDATRDSAVVEDERLRAEQQMHEDNAPRAALAEALRAALTLLKEARPWITNDGNLLAAIDRLTAKHGRLDAMVAHER